MGVGALQLLSVIEAADRATDLTAWSQTFSEGVRQTTGALACQLLRVHDGGGRLEVLGAEEPLAREVLSTGHGNLSGDQRRQLYQTGTAVACLGDVFGPDEAPDPLERAMRSVGIGDVIGLVAPPGVSVGVFVPERLRLDLRQRQVLASFAQHVGASVALRAETVPGAEPAALPGPLRTALEELDRRRRWARRFGDADDATSALAFLGALANEGYAVVEEARQGRRRRLVAVRVKDPTARALRALDDGERAVLEGLADGRSLQEIGFELGIAEATVSGRIARIRMKLGIDPRDEIVRIAAALRSTS